MVNTMPHSELLDVTVRTGPWTRRGSRGDSSPYRLVRCGICHLPMFRCRCRVSVDYSVF